LEILALVRAVRVSNNAHHPPIWLYSVTTLERGKHAVIMEMAVSAEIYFQPL
jgi:hypothetical protein